MGLSKKGKSLEKIWFQRESNRGNKDFSGNQKNVIQRPDMENRQTTTRNT